MPTRTAFGAALLVAFLAACPKVEATADAGVAAASASTGAAAVAPPEGASSASASASSNPIPSESAGARAEDEVRLTGTLRPTPCEYVTPDDNKGRGLVWCKFGVDKLALDPPAPSGKKIADVLAFDGRPDTSTVTVGRCQTTFRAEWRYDYIQLTIQEPGCDAHAIFQELVRFPKGFDAKVKGTMRTPAGAQPVLVHAVFAPPGH
jgi:hypothetical protein